MIHVPLLKQKIKENLRLEIVSVQRDKPVRIESERVLAERFGVSRVTVRAAIKELIAEGLLYQIKGSGTYVATSTTFTQINLAFPPDIKSDDPFYGKVLLEFTKQCNKHSAKINIINLDNPKPTDFCYPVLIVGDFPEKSISDAAERFPVIILAYGETHHPVVFTISFNDFEIGREAATRLIDSGCHHKIMLAGPDKYTSAHERRLGFLNAATKNSNNTNIILYEKMNITGGYNATRELAQYVDLAGGRGKIGIFAVNDWMALGCLKFLSEAAVIMPNENIVLIGCDDIPLAEGYNLSTFNLNAEELMEKVFELFQTVPSVDKPILLNARFIER